jgi:hypothetical protein
MIRAVANSSWLTSFVLPYEMVRCAGRRRTYQATVRSSRLQRGACCALSEVL